MKKEEFFKRLSGTALSNYSGVFDTVLQDCIRLRTHPASLPDLNPWQSRMGGRPAMPAEGRWPMTEQGVPLAFIAQLNLSDFSDLDKQELLPKTGQLYFFYDAMQESWGFDPQDRDKFQVIYLEESGEDFVLLEQPEELDEQGVYEACSLSAELEVSLSGIPDFKAEEFELFSELWEENIVHKLLGQPDLIQNPMELECQLVTNGLYCGDESGYNNPKARQLEAGAPDWILLLQVDSDQGAGMCWGDLGRLYFWIRKQELAERNFSNCWCILQCY